MRLDLLCCHAPQRILGFHQQNMEMKEWQLITFKASGECATAATLAVWDPRPCVEFSTMSPPPQSQQRLHHTPSYTRKVVRKCMDNITQVFVGTL